jgi:hypothetical protein
MNDTLITRNIKGNSIMYRKKSFLHNVPTRPSRIDMDGSVFYTQHGDYYRKQRLDCIISNSLIKYGRHLFPIDPRNAE